MNDEEYSTEFYGMLQMYMSLRLGKQLDITTDTKMKTLFNKYSTPMNTVFKKGDIFSQLHRELSNSTLTPYNYILSISPDTDTEIGKRIIIRQSADQQGFKDQSVLVSKRTASFRLRPDKTHQTFDINETSYDTLRLFIETATTEWPMIIDTLGTIDTYDHVLEFNVVNLFKTAVRMDYRVRVESSRNNFFSILVNAGRQKREFYITTAAEKTEESDKVYNTPLAADTFELFTVQKGDSTTTTRKYVNKDDLQSTITKYLEKANLETCFPEKLEQCVDRLMRLSSSPPMC